MDRRDGCINLHSVNFCKILSFNSNLIKRGRRILHFLDISTEVKYSIIPPSEYRSALLSLPIDGLCPFADPALSDRTLKLVEIFDYTELPHIDQLIADFFVLNDTARSDLFEYIKIMKNNHTDPKRKKILNKL